MEHRDMAIVTPSYLYQVNLYLVNLYPDVPY